MILKIIIKNNPESGCKKFGITVSLFWNLFDADLVRPRLSDTLENITLL